jgi:hypothetical protein
MALAAASDDADAATWKDVRKWFVTANKLEPDDPEPLILYYQSFLMEGAKPTENAALGLERALELAPQDTGLRMMAAQQFLRDGRAPDARAALAPVAYDPHGGGLSGYATRIIKALDEGGTEAAIEALRNAGSPEA